jgi:hypothetical protein
MTAILRQAAEKLREVDVRRMRFEAGRVTAVEALEAHLETLECDRLRC